jgi:hypothetical protein
MREACLSFLVVCVVAPLMAPAHAAESAETAPADALLSVLGADDVLDTTRRSVRSTVEWLASGVDSWFGNTPFENGGTVSDGRLSLGYFKRQDQNEEMPLRFNARFRLPNIEQRTYLFVGRDDDRELLTDTPEALSRQEALVNESAANNAFFAGFGLPVFKSLDLRLGLHGGLKPYAQARYHRPWEFSDVGRVEFRETMFWTVADHLGATTVVSYEHVSSPSLVVRWLNSATITQSLPHFVWSSSLGTYAALSEQRLLSLELLSAGTTGAGVGVLNYGLQTKFEQPIHQDWLRAEFLLGHFWPRQDPSSGRRPSWAAGCTVKMSI